MNCMKLVYYDKINKVCRYDIDTEANVVNLYDYLDDSKLTTIPITELENFETVENLVNRDGLIIKHGDIMYTITKNDGKMHHAFIVDIVNHVMTIYKTPTLSGIDYEKHLENIDNNVYEISYRNHVGFIDDLDDILDLVECYDILELGIVDHRFAIYSGNMLELETEV